MSRLPGRMKQTAIYFWVGAGGSLGAICRYTATSFFPATDFPFSTLVINLSGCFLLTYLTSILTVSSYFSRMARNALTIGFLGSLTTFSAFSLELFLLAGPESGMALLYFFASIGGGIFASWMGYSLARQRRMVR